MTLQLLPRSLILAPIESAYRTSYWSSIVTLMLSCCISEIFELLYAESLIFRTASLFRSKFQGVPLGVDPWCWDLQRAKTPTVKLFSNNSIHDTSTSWTDRHATCRSDPALCVASRDKNGDNICGISPKCRLLQNYKNYTIKTIKKIATFYIPDLQDP